MRRRLRAKSGRGAPKPTRMAWMTTAVILSASLLWFLLHLFATLSLGCEAVIAWWFGGGRLHPGLLQVTNLFVMTLALWLYVDIIRPKPVRVPVGIRVGQGVLVAVMVVLSVFQWGIFRPQSEEGRIYAYFQGVVVGWPVFNLFFLQPGTVYAIPNGLPENALEDPVFNEVRAIDAAYRREFPDAGIPREYGRAGGRYNGKLECTARHEVDAAWDRAYEAYFLAWQAEQE